MEAPNSPIMNPHHHQGGSQIILEDFLLKQGSRAPAFWHERYFVFSADNRLSYYNKRSDSRPKATFEISNLAECEISELYVSRCNKQMVYCVKISWLAGDDDVPGGASSSAPMQDDIHHVFSDTESFVSAAIEDREERLRAIATQQQEPPSPMPQQATTALPETPASAAKRKRPSSIKRLLRSRSGKGDDDIAKTLPFPDTERRNENKGRKDRRDRSSQSYNISLDNESISLPSQQRGGIHSLGGGEEVLLTRENNALKAGDPIHAPKIPTMVEVDRHAASTPLAPRFADDETTHMAGNKAKTPYEKERDTEEEYLRAVYLTTEKGHKRRNKQKMVEGTKLAVAAGATVGVAVVTAGIGLVAGLVFLGVGAAAGGSNVALNWRKKKTGEIVIAAPDYEKMRQWKACLDASLNAGTLQKSKWGQLFAGEGNKRRVALFPTRGLEAGFKSGHAENDGPEGTVVFGNTSKWRPLEGGWTAFLGTGTQGLRIFREERPRIVFSGSGPIRKVLNNLSVDGRPCPPMKAQTVLNVPALDAFLCLMSYGRLTDETELGLSPNSGQRASFRVIENIDDNTDVIHLVCNPLYLFPSWTAPRDFVLFRYWRLEPDGCFVVCYESVSHKDCPPLTGFVRGEMHQVFTIAPQKKMHRRKAAKEAHGASECLMTALIQVDPKGWVPIVPLTFLSDQGYGDAFTVAMLMQLLDIRDAIDQDRFASVTLDGNVPHILHARSCEFDDNAQIVSPVDSMESGGQDDLMNYDFSFAGHESVRRLDSPTALISHPPCLLAAKWAEPDANSFRVRCKSYKENRVKINAGPSIGRLVAVDVVNVDTPIYSGFTVHPSERVQMALKKDKILKEKGLPSDMPPFLFVVNIVLPGPPFYHGVFYYAIDNMSAIDGNDGTPSSLLCKEFIFGESDAFRDKTFKLIPQIVQGNFIVRKAVGSTPAIMGRKLRQLYVKTDRSFEVILDCGSSPVATGVIKLSLGYAKTLVVDMGFLLEGDDPSRLPERILGCCRIKELDFGPNLRRVEPVEHPAPRLYNEE